LISALRKTHFKAQPELPGRISHSEIIVADEADIKEDAAGDQSAQTTLSRLPDRAAVLIALSNRGKACSSKKRSAAPAET
jgi:hypothetical protein